jgi:hypothetical protein
MAQIRHTNRHQKRRKLRIYFYKLKQYCSSSQTPKFFFKILDSLSQHYVQIGKKKSENYFSDQIISDHLWAVIVSSCPLKVAGDQIHIMGLSGYIKYIKVGFVPTPLIYIV